VVTISDWTNNGTTGQPNIMLSPTRSGVSGDEGIKKQKKTSMPASFAAAAAASVRTLSWSGAPRLHVVYWRPVRRAVAESRVNVRLLSRQMMTPHHSTSLGHRQPDSLQLAAAAAVIPHTYRLPRAMQPSLPDSLHKIPKSNPSCQTHIIK